MPTRGCWFYISGRGLTRDILHLNSFDNIFSFAAHPHPVVGRLCRQGSFLLLGDRQKHFEVCLLEDVGSTYQEED